MPSEPGTGSAASDLHRMPDPLSVLVIDDEPRIRQVLTQCLERDQHRVTVASSPEDAMEAVQHESFDVAFLDLRLGVADGMDLIEPMLQRLPTLRIIVITAHASIDSAVKAMRRGATDYLPKPFSPDQVRLALRKAAELHALERHVDLLQNDLARSRPQTPLDSDSPAMQPLLRQARQVAASDATVLLRGESGTGKGVLARTLHAWSHRADGPFVTVHGPSFSAELFESELFGHVKGAFTGATQTSAGRVQQAHGGTLFLDEIGDLPLPLQPKLLRFAQTQEFERVGDPETRRADVRLLAATNQDLEAAVAEGRFREDLFYRLNVIELEVPPLRERPKDVQLLARQFRAFFTEKYGRGPEGFTGEAEQALRRHPWPGNVRELQNAIERAVILCTDAQIGSDHLPLRGEKPSADGASAAPRVGAMVTLAELEEAHIRRVIAATATLGIDPATLWRRRKQYGL